MTLRRDFLAFTAGAVAVLPLAARAKTEADQYSASENGPHPDAALIAVCEEYLRIEREFEAYYDTLPGDMEADDRGWEILEPIPALEEQIVALRATTPEGHLARARCVAFTYLPANPVCQDDPEAAREDRFRAAMIRDLVHMERGGEA
jgi:hypothetical protein